MPLTLETIKDVRLLPKADDKNQILQGAFQMPNNTHVVIDETEMSAGKLEGDVAMENLKGITVLIEECFVPCIIQYSETKFNISAPVTLFSAG